MRPGLKNNIPATPTYLPEACCTAQRTALQIHGYAIPLFRSVGKARLQHKKYFIGLCV